VCDPSIRPAGRRSSKGLEKHARRTWLNPEEDTINQQPNRKGEVM